MNMSENIIEENYPENTKNYPKGLWSTEPDYRKWKEPTSGYTCLVRRHPRMGFLCGYVEIKEDHPLFEKDYGNFEDLIEVHGGITFSDRRDESDKWWIGFDCAHDGDKTPIENGFEGVYRDFEWVVKETEQLAHTLYLCKDGQEG